MEHCNKCADVTKDLCAMMKGAGKSLWICADCEAKEADMKAVLDSMNAMKSELSTIKRGQSEQQVERTKVLEGLKKVEAVAKRMERVEVAQEEQEQRISKNEDASKKNTRKVEDGEKRITKVEERLENMDKGALDVRQCNAVAKEVREIEKREKNIVVFNVPEPTEQAADGADLARIGEILIELNLEGIQPKEVKRIGKVGSFPRQILVILNTVEDCNTIVKKCREETNLRNNVFITRDRTFNQRQEAKLFRLEKEKEERETDTQLGGGRGGGGGGTRGRGRPRGRGPGRGGRGGRGGGRQSDSESRKRRNSDDRLSLTASNNDDEAKRRRTGEEGAAAAAAAASSDETRPTGPMLNTASNPQESEAGAVGGEEQNF